MRALPPPLLPFISYDQFILYKTEPRKGHPGKLDKIPLNYLTGKPGNSQDPKIWLNAITAIGLSERHNLGVGFVFTSNDPFWFLDIDNCLDVTVNDWTPLAKELMQRLSGAAIEISTSNKGLHIFGMGNLPAHGCKDKQGLGLELYTSGRFVALTGTNAVGSASIDHTVAMTELINIYFPVTSSSKNSINTWSTEPCEGWNGPTDDNDLISRALRSQSAKAAFGGGACFRDLWEANYAVLQQVYASDDSKYDAALAQHLSFWTGNNCERMQSLMMQSALRRDKYEREDYLPRTITFACSNQKEWLCDKPVQERTTQATSKIPHGQPVTGTTYLNIEQQIQLFAGCTYVCDGHKILVPGGNLLKPDQFRVMFGGYTFPMDLENARTSRNAWECFTESQAFRSPKADSSCFRPDLEPGVVVETNGRTQANLWWPILTPRKIGNAERFLNHIKILVGNERDAVILLAYMAACVQFKGFKFQWCPLIQGVEGNGKTLLTRCVAYAIGDKYTYFPKAQELGSKFNDWLYGKIFIGVEDIYTPDRTEVIEIMKPMITSDRLEIEGKNQDKATREICCNFIINTNHKDGLRKTNNDRRFAPFYTKQQTSEDLIRDGLTGNYFSSLYNWCRREDGFAIVSELLHTYEIPDEFNPTTHCQRAPLTSSTADAISQGMGNIEQEILELIEQGSLGFKNGWISSIMLDKILETNYRGRRISHNKRRELLQSLGYDWHPGLTNGRVNNTVIPDGAKPRLFIKQGHAALALTNAAEIAKRYSDDQAC